MRYLINMTGVVVLGVSVGLLAAGCSKEEASTPPVPGSDVKSVSPAVTAPATGQRVAQTTCPVMGGAIVKSLFTDYKGKRIYVCCPGCVSVVKNDPEKYINKLEAQGVTLERVSK